MSYVWNGSGPLRRGRENDDWVSPGEEFEPTEAELQAFPDLIRDVSEDGDGGPDESEPDEPEAEPPFDPSEFTVGELRDHLDESGYSDKELAALEAAERDGEKRTTALEAITGIR